MMSTTPPPVHPSKKKTLDKSTLNFKKIEKPDSQRRFEGRYQINLHVKQTSDDIIKMIQPRGITIRKHGANVHKNKLAEGSLITVYCNRMNPDVLCQREYDELLDFVNRNFKVIRDNPYELKGFKTNTKIITKINSDGIADKAFNLEIDETGDVVGQL